MSVLQLAIDFPTILGFKVDDDYDINIGNVVELQMQWIISLPYSSSTARFLKRSSIILQTLADNQFSGLICVGISINLVN